MNLKYLTVAILGCIILYVLAFQALLGADRSVCERKFSAATCQEIIR